MRPREEAQKAHIKGAVNIPLEELPKAKDLFPPQKNAPTIIYSTKDEISLKAFEIIRNWGYVNTSYLAGGIEAWKQAGGEVLADQLAKKIVYVPKPKPGTIPIEEFRKIAHKIPDNVIILDVRDPVEITSGVIKNSINIPLSELKERLGELPKEKEIIIHCVTGVRAEMAYNILKEAGFKARYLDATIQVHKDGSFEITEN